MSDSRRPKHAQKTLGIVGIGLIGGAVALAARRHRAVRRIVAADRDPASLARARRRGIVDHAGSIDDVAACSDVLVLAVPPRSLAAMVPRVLRGLRAGCVATDTASTKRSIVDAIPRPRPNGPWFVPAHPLAGSERSGLDAATPDLLEGALCPVTPKSGTPAPIVRRIVQFWSSLGLRPFVVGAREHDRCVARTSHLPFVVASLLARGLEPSMRAFAGPALRDATRVAASESGLWVDILLDNRDEVLRSLHWLRADLEWFVQLLEREDSSALARALRSARRRRDDWSGEWAAR
ncbi:MAG: prephenate dehydrogenase/arogenate dehydrogenase family protein [Planctomycetes bacterium]|nr:prephenate dehydrogenase/arogenate dehydrogenase family protein [Planctomycetota bacterium]MBI3844543.1 prephenate dehydrogenase/arogenate dehydrogenase family protein [Planctomycetota bacterium]